jgi:hypothetical protein
LEISMPWGFMLSAVVAREEAERNDFVVKAGLDAALRAFRANIVFAGMVWKEGYSGWKA